MKTLRLEGEVALRAELTLLCEPKRPSVRLGCQCSLYAPRLLTHPTDEAFLRATADMPPGMLRSTLSLRQRLNGRAFSFDPTRLDELEAGRISAPRCLDTGTAADLAELLRSFDAACEALAARRLPVRTAAGLIRWVRERQRQAERAGPPGLDLTRSWTLRPSPVPFP